MNAFFKIAAGFRSAISYVLTGNDTALDSLVSGEKGDSKVAKSLRDDTQSLIAKIIDSGENFILTDKTTNIVFGTYTRRRDAVRGATRRGLKLAA